MNTSIVKNSESPQFDIFLKGVILPRCLRRKSRKIRIPQQNSWFNFAYKNLTAEKVGNLLEEMGHLPKSVCVSTNRLLAMFPILYCRSIEIEISLP